MKYYLCVRADEVNFHTTVIDTSVSLTQNFNVVGRYHFQMSRDDYAAGTYHVTSITFVDSADRENDGGTFKDWDTDIDGGAVAIGTLCEQSTDSLRYICHTAHDTTPIVSDDFSSDTSADYTAIAYGISISGGNVGGSTNWQRNMVYHETTLGSPNQVVKGHMEQAVGGTDGSSILFRIDDTGSSTGYAVAFGSASSAASISTITSSGVVPPRFWSITFMPWWISVVALK